MHIYTQSELSLSSVKLDGEGGKLSCTLQAAVSTYQFISHPLLTLIITALFMSLSVNLMGTDTLDCLCIMYFSFRSKHYYFCILWFESVCECTELGVCIFEWVCACGHVYSCPCACVIKMVSVLAVHREWNFSGLNRKVELGAGRSLWAIEREKKIIYNVLE